MDFVDLDASFHELEGVYHQSYFFEQIFLLAAFVVLFHIKIKMLFLAARDDVTSLCLAQMVVVN